MPYSHILFQVEESGIALLTVNRPEKLNALSSAVIAELADAFHHVAGDPAMLNSVLDVYGRYRLLTFDRDPVTRGDRGRDLGGSGVGVGGAQCLQPVTGDLADDPDAEAGAGERLASHDLLGQP